MKTRNSGPTTRDEFKETCYGKFTPHCFKSEKEHIAWLTKAINEGIESGFVENFNSQKYLKKLKRLRKVNSLKTHSR